MGPSTTEVPFVGHGDLDAFFASAAEVADPSLAGKAVAAGGTRKHGVVASANYVARSRGVRSAQSVAMARKLCPELVVVPVDFAWYRELSFAVLACVVEVADMVEPAGIDESYMSFGDTRWEEIEEVGTRLRALVRERTGLAYSLGIGVSKGVAKLASGAAKPDGLLVVSPSGTDRFLEGRQLGDVGGAGPATLERLSELGVTSVADLRAWSEQDAARLLGKSGVGLWRKVHGTDGVGLSYGGAPSSVGSEETLEEPVATYSDFVAQVHRLGEEAMSRLVRLGMGARGVTIKVRRLNRSDVAKSQSLGAPTNDPALVRSTLAGMTESMWHLSGGSVALVGVTLTGLEDSVQPRLDFTGSGWALRRAPRAGEHVRHNFFGEGLVAVGDPDCAVVRFSDRVRVIVDPRKSLEIL